MRRLSDSEFGSFQPAGISRQQMIETIAEIAHCTVTNFTNRLARTSLDDFTEKYAVWSGEMDLSGLMYALDIH